LGKLKSIISLARLTVYQLATQRSTFALISGQPAWFAAGDCDNDRTCCEWVLKWENLFLKNLNLTTG